MADPESTLAEPALVPAAEALVLGEGLSPRRRRARRRLPGSAGMGRQVTIGVVSGKLDWTRARDLVGQRSPGAVGLLPSSSGFVKVLTRRRRRQRVLRPVGHDDVCRAGSGVEARQYKNAQGPADPLDQVHFALDVIGLAPVFGGAADLANAVHLLHPRRRLQRLDVDDRILPGLRRGGEVARYGDDVVEFGSRSLLREAS